MTFGQLSVRQDFSHDPASLALDGMLGGRHCWCACYAGGTPHTTCHQVCAIGMHNPSALLVLSRVTCNATHTKRKARRSALTGRLPVAVSMLASPTSLTNQLPATGHALSAVSASGFGQSRTGPQGAAAAHKGKQAPLPHPVNPQGVVHADMPYACIPHHTAPHPA